LAEDQNVFKCDNCKKEKPDNKKGRVLMPARVGLWCLSFSHWQTCKDCEAQVKALGLVMALGALLFVLSLAFWIFKRV
jgi:hypothetical protein